ncbi:MAG: Hsp20/alpha crystallin family protein [Lachnospiraceae bacterium]|nr:Hsp20/alpha crystallin family protein [Lachnospiraceae bacterium]
MLLPSIFENDLFDNFFGFPFDEGRRERRQENTASQENENLPAKRFFRTGQALMRTDIRETDKAFELEIDLPGFAKDDVKVALHEGYLTVSAEKNEENEEKKEGKYLRKERFVGSCERRFYVGDDVTEEDIKAAFESGVLKLTIAKKEAKPVNEKKYITIG